VQLITVNSYEFQQSDSARFGVQYGLSTLLGVAYSAVTPVVSVAHRRLQESSTKVKVEFVVEDFERTPSDAEKRAETLASVLESVSLERVTGRVRVGVRKYGGNFPLSCQDFSAQLFLILPGAEAKEIQVGGDREDNISFPVREGETGRASRGFSFAATSAFGVLISAVL